MTNKSATAHMMRREQRQGKRHRATRLALAAFVVMQVALAGDTNAQAGASRAPSTAAAKRPATAATKAPPPKPKATYWVYVGAESADLIHRIRFGPECPAGSTPTGPTVSGCAVV